jgi:hypothetical protein
MLQTEQLLEYILQYSNIGITIADAQKPDMPLAFVNKGTKAKKFLAKTADFCRATIESSPHGMLFVVQ